MSSPTMPADQADARVAIWLKPLEAALQAYAHDRLSAGELAGTLRQGAAAHGGLPPRYLAVLEKLLQPLEASALFSEESCAFSRTDLARSLQEWLDAAAAVER